MAYKKLITPLICSMVILGAFGFYKYIYDGTEYIKSNYDNNFYKVRNLYGKQEKANLLAIINIKLNTIVKNLENSPFRSYQNVKNLITNWNNGVSIKEIGLLESDAAYVINKRYMSFCLPNDIDTNLMTYVGIHELSHIMSIETGHGPEFIQNFNFLLNYAKKINYTDPITNTLQPLYVQLDKLNNFNYCGVPLINSIN